MFISIILLYSTLVHTQVHAEAQSNCAICQEITQTYAELGAQLGKDSFPSEVTKQPGELQLTCLATPNAKNAIGVVQKMRVHAPLEKVAAVLDDFGSYAELFPELVKVEASPGAEPGTMETKWTESAPVFFMGNPVHELKYKIVNEPGVRKVYRSSLKKSRHLKYSEGLIVIAADGPDQTWFSEIDFYDADWSLLKILGSEKIWRENVKQLALSDLAVKFKAEKPSLNNKDAQRQAKKAMNEDQISTCAEKKTPFSVAALKGEFKSEVK